MDQTTLSPTRGIRPAQAAAKLGIGLSTLYLRLKNDPSFPRPRKRPGQNVTLFLESELDAYLAGGAQ